MSGLTSTRNFRLLLFHHSRCTTHNDRVKSVKSLTVTCLCALVYNIVYNIKENMKSVMLCPKRYVFGHFFTYFYYYYFTVRKANHTYIFQ